MENLFFELTLVLVLAGGCALAINYFKQPSIVAYIVAGLMLGPLGYWRLQQGETWHALSEIGITLVLFMVGLELDISELKKIGRKALVAGTAQVLITISFAFITTVAFGFSIIVAAYVALGLTLSSTIIVVKLLSEKKELQSLSGRLSLGILLIQDLVVLVVLMALSGSGEQSAAASAPIWEQIGLTLGKGILLAMLIAGISTYIFPRLLKVIGKSDELLLIFSLAWALGFATFVQLPMVGFSLEIGGFLAGLALSRSSVHHEISARIRSLRDFFTMIFFIVLGSQLRFDGLTSLLLPAVLLSLFVIVGKPLITLVILSKLGYKSRTAFLTGITMGQVSEFSLILMALAAKLGHVSEATITLLTLVAIITIATSSFSIVRAEYIYNWFAEALDWFDTKNGSAEKFQHESDLRNHVVLLGTHRTGGELAESFIKHRQKFIIVDFNPDVAEHYSRLGVPVICGDASDPYIQELAGFAHAKLIVSTLPNLSDNLSVVETIRNKKLKAKLIIMAQTAPDAKILYKHNVDYVLLPHYINGLHLARILKHPHPHSHLVSLRKQHLKALGA